MSQNKPIIAFDGKVRRGSYRNNSKTALPLVTAYDTERGLVLSQKPTVSKNGEIRVVRQLLDVINVKGSVITVDALHCQRETLENIARYSSSEEQSTKIESRCCGAISGRL
jgi:hypothetical protein